jgi:hypothetical protein
MSRFTVVWSEAAQDHLAQSWIDASDRNAVAQAGNAIDRELAVDPQNKGTEVSEGLRGLDVPPLRALFVVEEQDQLVRVVMVRLFQPPSPPANGPAEGA